MKREKFVIEFIFNASPTIVYQFLTAPDCIVRWFCEKVDIQGDSYRYFWGNDMEEAIIIDDIEDERLRFQWLESDYDNEYFEFRISRSEVTGDTILEIEDFSDASELADAKQLWTKQMEAMRTVIGG